MNWKKAIKEKIENLPLMKCAVRCIQMEIQYEDDIAERAHERYKWADPALRDDEEYQSERLAYMIKRYELLRNLEQAKSNIAELEAALAVLPEDDKNMISRVFLANSGKSVCTTAVELGYSQTSLYKKLDTALYNLASALYLGETCKGKT